MTRNILEPTAPLAQSRSAALFGLVPMGLMAAPSAEAACTSDVFTVARRARKFQRRA